MTVFFEAVPGFTHQMLVAHVVALDSFRAAWIAWQASALLGFRNVLWHLAPFAVALLSGSTPPPPRIRSASPTVSSLGSLLGGERSTRAGGPLSPIIYCLGNGGVRGKAVVRTAAAVTR